MKVILSYPEGNSFVCVAALEQVCINDGVEILTTSHDVGDPGWGHIK